MCKRLRLTPIGYARRPLCPPALIPVLGGTLRGFNSHSPRTCLRVKGSLQQRSAPTWASSFLISFPLFLTGLFPRRWFLRFVGLRSLSRQKQQRAPLRVSSRKLRGCFLLCACGWFSGCLEAALALAAGPIPFLFIFFIFIFHFFLGGWGSGSITRVDGNILGASYFNKFKRSKL